MQLIYSIGAKFAGGGIGNIAYHAVQGLHRRDTLHRLLCSSYRPTEIPDSCIRKMGWVSRAMRRLAIYGLTHYIHLLHSRLYDLWSLQYLEPCDVYHVWNNYGLHTIERANSLGAVTVVERASSHPITQTRLLREEYIRWNLPFHQPKNAVRRALRELERADYVLIPSDFVRDSFLHQGFPEDKLIQIPFGVDPSIFLPPPTKDDNGIFRVLYVGQVNVRKGILYLLEAWKELGWSDAELRIVGRPDSQIRPLLPQYQDLDSTRFMGYVTDPVSTFQSADVFAFPTIEEGSALVTYEAMACGLPVVTTPNAGSMVTDGIEGLLTPIRDVHALCVALERLRSDRARRIEMGKAARVKAEALTWARYGDDVVKAYRQCIQAQNK